MKSGSPSAQPPATPRRDQSFDIDLTAAGAPAFPLTLGIDPSGPPGGLQVVAQGLLAGNLVVEQSAATSFVSGEQRMLRMLLLDACVGATCPATPAPQTCHLGACQSAVVDGAALPLAGRATGPADAAGPHPDRRTDDLVQRLALLRRRRIGPVLLGTELRR